MVALLAVTCECSHTTAGFSPHVWMAIVAFLRPHTRWSLCGCMGQHFAFCLHIWMVTCGGFLFRFTCGASSLCGCMRRHLAFCLHIWIVTCDGFLSALHEKERALVIACDDIFPSASISESSHAAASFKLHMWRNEPHVITWDKYVAFCLRIWIVTCDGFRTFSFTCGASSLCGWMQQHFSFCLHIWIATCACDCFYGCLASCHMWTLKKKKKTQKQKKKPNTLDEYNLINIKWNIMT